VLSESLLSALDVWVWVPPTETPRSVTELLPVLATFEATVQDKTRVSKEKKFEKLAAGTPKEVIKIVRKETEETLLATDVAVVHVVASKAVCQTLPWLLEA
jgi:hypothetical protein